MAADPNEGVVLGRTYRLDALIGAGGMGSVYRASHTRLPRQFAVKLLKHWDPQNADQLERFKREAELACSVGHSRVVEVIDLDTADNGMPYIVMEFLHGEDLGQVLARQGVLPLGDCVHYLQQVCEVLDATHDKGIIHRDLKPSNLFLVTEDGQRPFIKVLDFGISKVLSQPDGTQSETIRGSAHYMAPEQARPGARIGRGTDVFALGAILYECWWPWRMCSPSGFTRGAAAGGWSARCW